MQYLNIIINVYLMLLIINVLMSWMPNVKESKIGRVISKMTEPYLNLFRFIPPINGVIDISPIIAIFIYQAATNVLVQLIWSFVI